MNINPVVELLFVVIALMHWVSSTVPLVLILAHQKDTFTILKFSPNLFFSLYFVYSQGQHQALVLASQARVEVDQDLARVVRAAEEVDPAMTVHGEPMMENGRPQDLARVNLGRAEEDQARVNQVSPRFYC